MKTANINADSLARHLGVVVQAYDRNAAAARANGLDVIATHWGQQATEARAYAAAFENIYSLGFADNGAIEVTHG